MGIDEIQIYIPCNIPLRWIAHVLTLICIFLSPQWVSEHRGGREEQRSHADTGPDGSEIWLIALLLLRTLVPPAWRTLSVCFFLSIHPSTHLFIFPPIKCAERTGLCWKLKFSIDGCLHVKENKHHCWAYGLHIGITLALIFIYIFATIWKIENHFFTIDFIPHIFGFCSVSCC